MGFKVKRKSYRLVFGAGSDLEGATVVMGPMNMGEFLMLARAGREQQNEDTMQQLGLGMLDTVAGKLVSWDLEEEDGTPIPATKEGVLSLEVDTVLVIINAWTFAAKGVSVPLPETSSDGERQTLEASIPMEAMPPVPETSS